MRTPTSRIERALERVERSYPNDREAQRMSLVAELVYSAQLTPADREAFRFAIADRRPR